ncbi:MAG: hypothetical protein BMS9Abin33_0145 [Gammaproteobacteria bacterium]|nr:MAG: hypothetical protein BMS9Abin33_0145 [Gammaproteobacteria bacterium]
MNIMVITPVILSPVQCDGFSVWLKLAGMDQTHFFL